MSTVAANRKAFDSNEAYLKNYYQYTGKLFIKIYIHNKNVLVFII